LVLTLYTQTMTYGALLKYHGIPTGLFQVLLSLWLTYVFQVDVLVLYNMLMCVA